MVKKCGKNTHKPIEKDNFLTQWHYFQIGKLERLYCENLGN